MFEPSRRRARLLNGHILALATWLVVTRHWPSGVCHVAILAARRARSTIFWPTGERSEVDDMAGMGIEDDPLLAILRYARIVFVVVGVGFVTWLARQRLPFELQPDILAALSD